MARVLSATSVSPGTVSASACISYRPREGGVHVKVSVLLVPFIKVMVWVPIRGSVKSVVCADIESFCMSALVFNGYINGCCGSCQVIIATSWTDV